MNCALLNNISMNGRMAYSIMCIENYLKNLYPFKNWALLSKKMWPVTSSYWDEWADMFIEIIPQYLFEFQTYKDSNFEHLSESDYIAFSNLFHSIPSKGDTDEINNLLLKLLKLEEVYSYSEIPNFGTESIDIVMDICTILESHKISLPDIDKVQFSSFNEKKGWGNQFDGEKLSIILNN